MLKAETLHESKPAIEFKALSFFSKEGVLARKLAGFESRPEQVEMAQAAWVALAEGHHLIVEAGTGVGKSLAYLIPVVQYAKAFKKRLIVSTYTKTLQHQLIDKDIPFLKENLGIQFNASLCMGSENYICLNRLERVVQSQIGIFETKEAVEQFNKIMAWAKETKTGLRTELDFEPLPAVWEEVGRQGDLCLGKRCGFRDHCFYKKARALWNSSDVLVVNHYLFFTNLGLEGAVLPDYHAVIFDEAHNIEDVASRFFWFEIKWSGIRYILTRIFNQRTGVNLRFLMQGQMPQARMLEIFKNHEKTVILGVNTFWQGVDVPGEALQMVIIPKLPFPVPTDPIVEARAESIKRNGMNPFMDYFLPHAAMMLKQGFGRLIRTKDDVGIVAVLDPRMKTRSYGRFFLETLPECTLAEGMGDVKKFFEGRV